MLLDVAVDKESLSIDIADPFRADMDAVVGRIGEFAGARNADISALNIRELIARMIRGVAGCEKGCPADAKGIVSRGFEGFNLQYIEGGILSAEANSAGGARITFKMFPDF